MRVGALIFVTDRTIRPDQIGVELEQRGYESLWVPEHTHIPTGRRTPYPGGGELPDEYRRTLDPPAALSSGGRNFPLCSRSIVFDEALSSDRRSNVGDDPDPWRHLNVRS